MRRYPVISVLVITSLAVAACSNGKKKDTSHTNKPSACKEILTDDGIKWLKESVSHGDVQLKQEDSVDDVRSEFEREAKKWDSIDTGKPRSNTKLNLCRASSTEPNSDKRIGFRFGPSSFPFDFPFSKASTAEESPTEVSLNADVKLVYGKNLTGDAEYRVFVKCRISGADKTQENEVPFAGTINDTLTDSIEAPRVPVKHLLQSTQKIVNGLSCKNSPEIPSEPPASIKDK